MLEQALKLIEDQRAAFAAGSLEFGVGAKLMELCRADARLAQLVAEDMQSQTDALKQIGQELWDYAKKHKSGSSYYMDDATSTKLIYRHFHAGEPAPAVPTVTSQAGKTLSLLDFM